MTMLCDILRTFATYPALPSFSYQLPLKLGILSRLHLQKKIHAIFPKILSFTDPIIP
jgi:hypothetical protein